MELSGTEVLFGLAVVAGYVSTHIDTHMTQSGMRGASQTFESIVLISSLVDGLGLIALFAYSIFGYSWAVAGGFVAFFFLQRLIFWPIVSSVSLFGQVILLLSILRPVLSLFCGGVAAWLWWNWFA